MKILLKKKNYIDPIEKKKDEIYLYDEKEKIKKLEEIKIQNQEKIIEIKKNIINYKCITMDHFINSFQKKLILNKRNTNIIKEYLNLEKSKNPWRRIRKDQNWNCLYLKK